MSDETHHLGVDGQRPFDGGKSQAAHGQANIDNPTTTNAAPGEGRPRLIFKVRGEALEGELPRQFDLLDPVTRIGSNPEMDLVLDGLEPFHAEIRHVGRDEYVFNKAADLGQQHVGVLEAEDASAGNPERDADGATNLAPGVILRTGAELAIGPWLLSYYREEFADHGRPFGGREGGEGTYQPQQPA